MGKKSTKKTQASDISTPKNILDENPPSPPPLPKNDDHRQKVEINPWGTDIIGEEDYDRLCAEFGIQHVNELDIPASFFEQNRFFRRKIVFGHRDFDGILKAMREGRKWAIMSGIKPSGKFHLGTLTTASEMVELQKQGGYVYYGIADIESHVDNGMSYEDSFKNAVDNIADILTLGLDPNRAYIWLQSKEPIPHEMPFEAGRHVTMNMINAIYGDREFALYMAALVQVGDILLPQLKNDVMPTVVPVGIDQDPHLRLVRDLSRHFNKAGQPLFKPAATYHKLMPALDDINQKMSKSRPQSYFNFSDDPKSIKTTLLNAYTGGRGNKEDQIKLGGIPERCMIYKIMEWHFEPDDQALASRYTRCRGGLLCGTCKKEVIEKVLAYIANHNERKRKNLLIAEKILSQ
jgi:tryptophanyl-tRNA synthetase